MREKITDKISKRDKLSERIKNALLACFNAIGPVWNFLFVKTPDPDALHADEIWHDCYVLRHNFSCLASRLASKERKAVLEQRNEFLVLSETMIEIMCLSFIFYLDVVNSHQKNVNAQ